MSRSRRWNEKRHPRRSDRPDIAACRLSTWQPMPLFIRFARRKRGIHPNLGRFLLQSIAEEHPTRCDTFQPRHACPLAARTFPSPAAGGMTFSRFATGGLLPGARNAKHRFDYTKHCIDPLSLKFCPHEWIDSTEAPLEAINIAILQHVIAHLKSSHKSPRLLTFKC
jgi:hypothetical protein